MSETEKNIQQECRLSAGEVDCITFRINVGTGITGNGQVRHNDGSITVKNARPFSTGVPAGFSDLLVIKSKIITQDMVGQKIGIAGFAEVKTKTGRVRPEQVTFIDKMLQIGCIAGIVRSAQDFKALFK